MPLGPRAAPEHRALGRRGCWSDTGQVPALFPGGRRCPQKGGRPQRGDAARKGLKQVKTSQLDVLQLMEKRPLWKLRFGRHLPLISWNLVFLVGVLGHKDPHQPSPYLLKLNLGKSPNDSSFFFSSGHSSAHWPLSGKPESGSEPKGVLCRGRDSYNSCALRPFLQLLSCRVVR